MLKASRVRRLAFPARVVRSVPHPAKILTGGEDAYAAAPNVLAVADGVGEWTRMGIDAAMYSRMLMKNIYEHAYDAALSGDKLGALDLLERAHDDSNDVQGSATAVVATINGDDLEVLNLGDSGCMVVNGYGVVLRTEEQQSGLNKPYQLGPQCRHKPSDAEVMRIRANPGDLVVMGSDGLFDNLYDQDVLAMLHEYVREVGRTDVLRMQAALDAAATDIVAKAVAVSQDRHAATPFAEKMLEGGYQHSGGKKDDITLLVAVVGEEGIYNSGSRTNESMADAPVPYTAWPM